MFKTVLTNQKMDKIHENFHEIDKPSVIFQKCQEKFENFRKSEYDQTGGMMSLRSQHLQIFTNTNCIQHPSPINWGA